MAGHAKRQLVESGLEIGIYIVMMMSAKMIVLADLEFCRSEEQAMMNH